RLAHGSFDALADDEEFALEGHVIAQGRAALDEELADFRLDGAGRGPEVAAVGRHRAPAEELLAFLLDDVNDEALAQMAVVRVSWEEEHPHAVVSGLRQLD